MRKADTDLSTIQFSIRVPSDWPQRADKLIEKLSPPGMTFSRMDVFRAAISTGFEKLEEQASNRRYFVEREKRTAKRSKSS